MYVHMYLALELCTCEKSFIHSSIFLSVSVCQFSNTEEYRTKCFSSLLMSGVGNSSYTVVFSAMRISLGIGGFVKAERKVKLI